ncbi:hypothetical protein H5395_15890 [Paracoccus sp. MC1854]|uniref:hypothetical protein n=1 Tax=Paracoccus sp. MC1854 TaxID=2760306 RepID=UPI001603353F|nr:hypothetical protein [Paracoccus sp. MC1854]MBB1492969.1 hypothetical protein [Paracoccus sp. MC1854]
MILYFDDGLRNWSPDLNDRIEEAVIRLVDADTRGDHYFILRRPEATWLLENFAWPNYVRARIDRLAKQYASRGDLIRSDKVQCVIVEGSSGFQRRVGQRLFVGIEFLCLNSFVTSKTRLVVEDIGIDAELHKVALDFSRRIVGGPSFNFEPIHSGGNGMGKVFEHAAVHGYFVAAIADSDRVVPGGALGATGKGLLSCRDRLYGRDDCLVIADVLPCHEAENVLPLSCAVIAGHADNPLVRAVKDIEQRSGVGVGHDAWSYLDLKGGFDGAKTADKVINGELPSSVLEWFSGLFACEQEQLDTIKIQGLGPRFASELLNSGRAMAEFHRRSRDDTWTERFARFYEDFIWFMAAPTARQT